MLVSDTAVLVLDFVVPLRAKRRNVSDMEIHIVWTLRILASLGWHRLTSIGIGSGQLVIVVAERLLQGVEIFLLVSAYLGNFLHFLQ